MIYGEMNFIVRISPILYNFLVLLSELVNILILGNVSEFDNNLDYANKS